MEMAQAVGTTLSRSTVTGNGKDGQQYNGDGVGLNGTGGSVVDNTISDNGDGVGFEHGIYAGATANGYLIARNLIGNNAGADVKAAGGPGRGRGQSPHLLDVRARDLRQPGRRDGRVQPRSRDASSTGS